VGFFGEISDDDGDDDGSTERKTSFRNEPIRRENNDQGKNKTSLVCGY
jgi:hypothetical protein